MQKNKYSKGLLENRFLVNVSQLLAQTSYNFYFTLRELGEDSSIIVYQMGKVGSTTISETLKQLPLNQPIYHVHHLTDDGLRIEELKAADRERPAFRREHYWAGRYLQRQLNAGAKQYKNWYVITLTRDPIARNLSGFFHSMPASHPNLYAQLAVADRDQLFPEIKETFLRDHPHNRPLEWLDVEMRPALNIDVYERPFPWTKGYSIMQRDNVHLLILRLEDLTSAIHEAFGAWLEQPFDEVEIVSANRAEEKPYLQHYRAFQDWLTLPAEYISRMYESKFARHFYAADELESFRRKWAG